MTAGIMEGSKNIKECVALIFYISCSCYAFDSNFIRAYISFKFCLK